MLTLTTIRGAGVVFFLIKWFIKLFVFYEFMQNTTNIAEASQEGGSVKNYLLRKGN